MGSRDNIANIVHSTIQKAPSATNFILKHHDALPDDPLPVETILQSIKTVSQDILQSCGKTTKTIWNVYTTSPTAVPWLHLQWCNTISVLSFKTHFYGTEVAHDNYVCQGYKSINHPTGLCPFSAIPGWLSPLPMTDIPSTTSSLCDSPHSCSTRGRGGGCRGASGGSQGQ